MNIIEIDDVDNLPKRKHEPQYYTFDPNVSVSEGVFCYMRYLGTKIPPKIAYKLKGRRQYFFPLSKRVA